MARHQCPVCGYPDLHDPPRSSSGGASFEICPSCGFEFGVSDDDIGYTYDEWRLEWVADGMPWRSARLKPDGWDPAALTSPTLADVAEKLRSLLAGSVSRREVSMWAGRWITADDPQVDDDVVWRALQRLGGADLKGDETEFLYYDIDFHAWLDEVEDAIEARPDPGSRPSGIDRE